MGRGLNIYDRQRKLKFFFKFFKFYNNNQLKALKTYIQHGQETFHEVWDGEYPYSVADPDPGSGIWCFLTPGSGIRNRFFPDSGSQDHIFKSFLTIFLVKSSIIL
jgi:hypothetical protein